jgi:hypothetical protein
VETSSSREQREEGMDPCEQVRDSRGKQPLEDLGGLSETSLFRNIFLSIICYCDPLLWNPDPAFQLNPDPGF